MANVVTTKVVTSQCKLILASGEFSSTIKTSQTIGSAGNPDTLYPTWNGNNTPAVFDNVGVTRSLKLYS